MCCVGRWAVVGTDVRWAVVGIDVCVRVCGGASAVLAVLYGRNLYI